MGAAVIEDRWAAWTGAGATLVATVWHVWLRLRRSSSATNVAVVEDGGKVDVVTTLRDEVGRLARTVVELSDLHRKEVIRLNLEIDVLRAARRELEDDRALLQRRVDGLERLVKGGIANGTD